MSCLRGLRGEIRLKLVKSGIVLIGQLISEDLYELAKKTSLPQEALREIVEKARLTSNAVWHA